MPILQLWSEKYAQQGLRVVGVTEMSTDAKIIRKALEEVGVKYPAVTDFGEKISKRYKIESHPTTYLIDRQGVIRHIEEGFVKGDEVEMQKLVEKLLASSSRPKAVKR